MSGKSCSSLSGCDPSVLSRRNALQHTSLAVGGPSWIFDSCCTSWMGLFSVFLVLPKALGQTDSLRLASMHLLYPDCNASPLPRPVLLFALKDLRRAGVWAVSVSGNHGQRPWRPIPCSKAHHTVLCSCLAEGARWPGPWPSLAV